MIAALSLENSFHRFIDAAGTFFDHFSEINYAAAAIGLLLYLGMLLARSKTWQNTLKAAYPGHKVPYDKIAAAYVAGAGLNSFIPARVGDVTKIFLAKRSIRGSS